MTEYLRYPEKFVSADGLLSYTFLTDDMEYQEAQAFRQAVASPAGGDYAHDFRGLDPWAKDLGQVSVRFTIWKDTAAAAMTEFDSCAATLLRAGRGKLYTIDQAGVERWCWAKLVGRPSYTVTADQFLNMPCEADFARFSDWFDATATADSQAIDATPKTFTITNPGNLPTTFVVFRLRSNGASGYTNPTIENTTNGYAFQVARTAVDGNEEERVNSETNLVERSTDDGSTYAADYSKLTRGNAQVAIMRLEPGDNTFSVTDGGTPDWSLEWSFYGAWA